jgi:alpha-beta hydrolase superfamily lysophospholipase
LGDAPSYATDSFEKVLYSTPNPSISFSGKEAGNEPVLATFTSSDGYRWYYRHFDPPARPLARLVFVHGIRSHSGWYTRSCTELAAAGYEVDFLDRRGGGLNTAFRGDAPNFRRLLDDVTEFLLVMRQTRPWLPIYLGGISWGGKLAVGLPYRRPGLIDGIILLCPGLCPQIAPPLGQRLDIGRARLRNPGKLFPIPLNEPELFTASPTWRQYIANDRYGLRLATARFLFSSNSLDIYLRRAVKWVSVPVLLLLAEHDRIIDNTATRRLLSRFTASRNLTIIDYPGAHHTLEFEPDGHPFVRDIMRWIEKRLKTQR